MAVNDLQNLEIGEITENGDIMKTENDDQVSNRKQQLRLLGLALYTVGEEELHLKNVNNALNAFKKAKNTLKRFFGEKDATFKKYNETYERISKRVLNNKPPKQMPNNIEMSERPSENSKFSERPSSKSKASNRPLSGKKRVSLKGTEELPLEFGNNVTRKGNLAPISPNCINSVSDLSSVDNTVKKGILKPPKPRNFNNRTYEHHNNSRLNNSSHTKSKLSANTPINEALCESDDEVFEQVNMQKNMLDFFDNMVQHVGPNHRINK